MTLKIRSRSPKHNQLFNMSQFYIHANLVKIWQPVHDIMQTRKCHVNADADTNRIRTKNNMFPSPSVGVHNLLPLSFSQILYRPLHLHCLFNFFISSVSYCYIIKQLLIIEALNRMWYPLENTNTDLGDIASVNNGIFWWISHHIQCLNSQ